MKFKNLLFYSTFFLLLIVGIWIVKAQINFYKLNKAGNTALINKKVTSVKTITSNKKNLNHLNDDDEFTSYISTDSVFLYAEKGQMKITDITPTTAISVYGSPLSQTTVFSDVDNANVLVYKYPDGEIDFLDNKLLTIEVTDEGFSFAFLKPGGSFDSFTSGTEGDEIYNRFISSWKNGNDTHYGNGNNAHIIVYLKTSAGVKTDAQIIFDMVDGISTAPGNNTVHTITFNN
jgi:hypothetical protein